MATLTLPNTILNATTTDASKVQGNDAAIAAFVNASVVQVDGAIAMTGALTLVAADPTLANHATRKSYTDALVANLPKGLMGQHAYGVATNSGVSGAFADTGCSVTFTAVAGRKYKLSYTASRIACASATVVIAQFTDATNTLIAYVGVADLPASASDQMSGQCVWSPAAGSQTVKVRASSSVASATVFQQGTYSSYLIVEDIGV